jgi:hypothetical protein
MSSTENLMKIFPFNLPKPFSFNDLDPAETGSYPHPPTEEQIEWMPEDGYPAGDEPLALPEGENPFVSDSELTDEVPS